jgi:ATP-binding cassette, subfamily B, bacterial PglK
MINFFKSLQTVLSSDDLIKVYILSFLMICVAAIEVFGLILLSFLIVNINNLESSFMELVVFNSLLEKNNFFNENLFLVLALFIITYAAVTSIAIFYTLKYVTISSQVIGSKIKLNLINTFLDYDWSEVLNTKNSENISRILNDGNELGTLINFLLHLFCKLVIAIMIISILVVYDPLLTMIVSFSLTITYLAIFFYFRPLVDTLSNQASLAKDKTVQIISNLFGSMKEIIIYGNQKDILESFVIANKQHAYAMGENYFLAQAPRSLIDTMLIILLATSSILINYMSLNTLEFFASFAVFGIAALKLLPAFQNIFNFTHEINMRMPYLKNTVEIFSNHRNNNHPSKNEFKKITKIEKIEYKNVSFKYQNSSQDAISNINLSIQEGDKVAIIGPSGAGKSTLIDILLGLLTPHSGHVNVNNINLKEIDKQNYRSLFSYVPQKLYLLEDSVKKNILFGMDNVIENNDLHEAIEMSQVTNFVESLPEKLDTIIADGNASFSGGQKQCIGMARAFCRKRGILILDESTNAMDADLEDIIFTNIDQSTFKTVILITHKPSLLKRVDKIIVMNNKVIESVGTFQELLVENLFLQQMAQSANVKIE